MFSCSRMPRPTETMTRRGGEVDGLRGLAEGLAGRGADLGRVEFDGERLDRSRARARASSARKAAGLHGDEAWARWPDVWR